MLGRLAVLCATLPRKGRLEYLMYIDAMTLAAVADELRILLVGARIDTIIQPTEHAIALQCYTPHQGQGGQNRWLYLSTHPQFARAHLTALNQQKLPVIHPRLSCSCANTWRAHALSLSSSPAGSASSRSQPVIAAALVRISTTA